MANPHPKDTKDFAYGVHRGEPPEDVINASLRWGNIRKELAEAHVGDWVEIPIELVAPEEPDDEKKIDRGIGRARTAAFDAAEQYKLTIATKARKHGPRRASLWINVTGTRE